MLLNNREELCEIFNASIVEYPRNSFHCPDSQVRLCFTY